MNSVSTSAVEGPSGKDQASGFDKTYMMKWFVCLLMPTLILLTPVNESINYTANLRLFFGITAFGILLLAFSFFDALIPAIFLPTAYYLSGIAPINIAFGSWTSAMVWMIIGALLLATILEECGLLVRIALWCVRKCGGTYNGALYGVFLAGLVVNIFTFGNAFIIMITLGYGVCRAMKLKVSRESALLCVVTLLGGLSPVSFVYNPLYNAIAISAIRTVAPSFTIEWYDVPRYLGLIMVPACLFTIWLFTRIFRTDKFKFEGGRAFFDEEYNKLGSMTAKEKKALIGVLILVVYLFTEPLTHLPAAWGFMTIPYILYLPGINVATAKSCKNMNWSALFFMASCLCISFVSTHLGGEKFISHAVTPLLKGHGALFAACALLFFGTIANLFMTPYAMMAALTMPFAAVGLGLGIAPIASLMALQLTTDMIFFPYEAAAPLIMYGFGYMPMKEYIVLSTIKVALTVVIFLLVIYPYWNWLGFLG